MPNKTGQAHRHRRHIAEAGSEAPQAVSHRASHEVRALQVVGDGGPTEITGRNHGHLFPAEGEYEAGDQRPFQPRPDEPKHGAVGRKPKGQETQVNGQRWESPAEGASTQRDDQKIDQHHGREYDEASTEQIRQILPRPGRHLCEWDE